MLKIYKRDVNKEIKTIARERVGRVKSSKVIKSKKAKKVFEFEEKLITKSEHSELGLDDPNFWELF